MKKEYKIKNILLIFLLIINLVLSLITIHPVLAQDNEPSWPTNWIYFSLDPNENTQGPDQDRRDVHHSYYYFDENFLYLRLECYSSPNFILNPDSRYKWFIDLDHNGHFSGQNIVECEYLLFVEDFNNNSINNDGVGDVFLLEDLNSNGYFEEWEEPQDYYSSRLVTDMNVAGYRILENYVDLYVNLSYIGNPSESCFLWATDQENSNLEQGPTLDSINIADLSISKTDNPDPAIEGGFLNYTITVTNLGPNIAENVNITDVIPSSVIYNSANPLPSNSNDLTYWWIFPFINVGNTEIITMNVTIDIESPISIINNVNVISDTYDHNLINNYDSSDTTINLMNRPPTVGDIPDQTKIEGINFDIINLDNFVEDKEDPDNEITWTHTDDGECELAVDITNRIATITPPDENWNGQETITFIATDTELLTDSDTATFTITPQNDPPIAVNDNIFLNEDSLNYQLDVLLNDIDIDGDDLEITDISQPNYGNATFNVDYIFYTPDTNYNGIDQLSYTITDNKGGTDIGIINLTIISKNDPPNKPFNPIPINESTNIEPILELNWTCSDIEGDQLEYEVYISTINPPTLKAKNIIESCYQTSLDFGETYYWMVRAIDIYGASNSSETWTFTVKEKPTGGGGNKPPNANDDSVFTNIGTPLWIDVLANDNDPDGKLNPSTVEIINNPIHGKVNLNTTTGEIKYTPDTKYHGNDIFRYKVKDLIGAFSNIADVAIEIGGVKADASAGMPYFGFPGQEIIFNGSFSFDPDPNGFITSWKWDFGDGTNRTGETTTHIYSESGNYTAILTVTDNQSDIDTDIFNVLIISGNNPPLKTILFGPKIGHKNIIYNFSAFSTDLDNDTIQYIIDWGDGENITTDFLPSGYPSNQTHKWSDYGEYLITVIAFDNKTDSEIAEYTILIDVLPFDRINGFLIDLNSNGTYDVFYNKKLDMQIDLIIENGSYLIDSDNDKKCDYTFNYKTGLLTYYEYLYQKYLPIIDEDLQAKEAPGFELLSIIFAFAFIFLIFKRRR